MKDIYTQFREQAKHIRVTPHPGTWDRVGFRLRAHRGTRKLFMARLLNIAAAVIVLVAVGVSVVLYAQKRQLLQRTAYTAHIAELHSASATSESIYDIDNIRRSWSDLGGNLN